MASPPGLARVDVGYRNVISMGLEVPPMFYEKEIRGCGNGRKPLMSFSSSTLVRLGPSSIGAVEAGRTAPAFGSNHHTPSGVLGVTSRRVRR